LISKVNKQIQKNEQQYLCSLDLSVTATYYYRFARLRSKLTRPVVWPSDMSWIAYSHFIINRTEDNWEKSITFY